MYMCKKCITCLDSIFAKGLQQEILQLYIFSQGDPAWCPDSFHSSSSEYCFKFRNMGLKYLFSTTYSQQIQCIESQILCGSPNDDKLWDYVPIKRNQHELIDFRGGGGVHHKIRSLGRGEGERPKESKMSFTLHRNKYTCVWICINAQHSRFPKRALL